MGCFGEINKYLILVFNVLFTVVGIILIVVGSMLLSNTSHFSKIVTNLEADTRGPQIFVIGLGIVIFFISIVGYVGALKENRLLLVIFSGFLVFIFFIQLSAGIYILLYELNYTDRIEKGLKREFKKISDPVIGESFQNMEKTLDCCGVRGESDYTANNMKVPDSCCGNKVCDVYWQKGCAVALDHFVKKGGTLFGSVTISLCIFEVLASIFAICFAAKVKPERVL